MGVRRGGCERWGTSSEKPKRMCQVVVTGSREHQAARGDGRDLWASRYGARCTSVHSGTHSLLSILGTLEGSCGGDRYRDGLKNICNMARFSRLSVSRERGLNPLVLPEVRDALSVHKRLH